MNRNTNMLLFALCLPVSLACIDVMAVGVGLDQIMNNLHSPLYKTELLISGYTIGTAAFLIIIGKLADLYGRKKLLLYGIILFGLSSGIAMLSNSINILVVCRLLQGVSGAAMMTTVISIITYHYPPETRTKVIAQWSFSLSCGLSLGPLIGGILVKYINWRAIFAVNIPICAYSYYLTHKFVPESKAKNISKINYYEALILSALMVSGILVLSQFNTLELFSTRMLLLLSSFILLLLSFIVMEIYLKQPIIESSLFRINNFSVASICGFTSYASMYSWLFIFGIYLQNGYGMSPIEAGLSLIPFSVAAATASIFIGKLNHLINIKATLQTGFLLAIITFFWMTNLTPDTPIIFLIIMFFLLGLMLTMVNIPSMTLMIKYIPADKTGIASGIIFTIRWIGGSIGVSFSSLIFNLFEHMQNYSIINGLHAACFSLAILNCIALVISTLLNR